MANRALLTGRVGTTAARRRGYVASRAKSRITRARPANVSEWIRSWWSCAPALSAPDCRWAEQAGNQERGGRWSFKV